MKKPEFLFQTKDGRDKLQATGMSVMDVAAMPAYIARKFYATLLRREPAIAEPFRKTVIQIITDPITWDVKKSPTPDIEMYVTAPGGDK